MEIPNFPGYYITEDGYVINPNGNILSAHQNHKGYWRVNIPGHNTQFIHRLLAYAYIPNPNNLPIVDHIDQNKENNDISNLRWVDDSDSVANRRPYFKTSTTKQRHIYYMKNRHGTYKYVYLVQKKVDGKMKKTAEKWFDTLDEAIKFRDSQ
jgi:hypothetical protein